MDMLHKSGGITGNTPQKPEPEPEPEPEPGPETESKLLRDVQLGTKVKIPELGIDLIVAAKNHSTHPSNSVCLITEKTQGNSTFYDEGSPNNYLTSILFSRAREFQNRLPENLVQKMMEVDIESPNKNRGAASSRIKSAFVPAAGEILVNFYPEAGFRIRTFELFLQESKPKWGANIWSRSMKGDSSGIVYGINAELTEAISYPPSNSLQVVYALVVSDDTKCKAKPNSDGSFDLIY